MSHASYLMPHASCLMPYALCPKPRGRMPNEDFSASSCFRRLNQMDFRRAYLLDLGTQIP